MDYTNIDKRFDEVWNQSGNFKRNVRDFIHTIALEERAKGREDFISWINARLSFGRADQRLKELIKEYLTHQSQ